MPAPKTEPETAWPSAEHRFRAMGTDCHVIVVGPRPQAWLETALARIDQLEARWSRFRPTSEVSELNRRAGHPVAVSPDTVALLDRAIEANRLTGGRFDATLGQELIDLGYDRPFDQLPPTQDAPVAGSAPDPARGPVRPPAGPPLTVDTDAGTAMVAAGRRFDPGGIGKGLAADLVVDELLAGGAWGAMVNLGGDLRVGGSPPSGPTWVVALDHPNCDALRVVELVDGGLATSTTLRRRWSGRTGVCTHLLDPATRRPHHTGADYVTVIATRAWWAEAAATSLIGTELAGSGFDGGADPLLPPGCAALLVEGDSDPRHLGPFADYEQAPA